MTTPGLHGTAVHKTSCIKLELCRVHTSLPAWIRPATLKIYRCRGGNRVLIFIKIECKKVDTVDG